MKYTAPLRLAVSGLLLACMAAAVPAASDQSTAGQMQPLVDSVEAFWSQRIASLGGHYRPPKLQFFTTPLHDVCAVRADLSGPLYCTVNETVYLDQAFLRKLVEHSPLAPDFTLGFVIAHEAGHHIQNVIGTSGSVQQSLANSTPALAQRIFTAFELQTDCYAGLWLRWAGAHGTIAIPPDLSVSVAAIAQVSQVWQSHLSAGQQMLDPLSVGTGEQRLRWIRRGLDSGNFNDCDTFGADAAGTL